MNLTPDQVATLIAVIVPLIAAITAAINGFVAYKLGQLPNRADHNALVSKVDAIAAQVKEQGKTST